MDTEQIKIHNEETLIATQLQIGKMVMIDLLKMSADKTLDGVKIPISVNGTDFELIVRREY